MGVSERGFFFQEKEGYFREEKLQVQRLEGARRLPRGVGAFTLITP